jgi:uncharacterized RDD family membrane protein YckC
MTFGDELEINTSEGIVVEMSIAGIGSRSLAWLIDGLILLTVLVLIGLGGLLLGGWDAATAMGVSSLAGLVLPLVYLVAFETLNGGRTIGKMAAGIKTVKVSGAPVGFGAALGRALLLVFDVAFAGIGLVTMLLTKQSRRLGDLAAGTVVVRDRVRTASPYRAPVVPPGPTGEHRWDVTAVTEPEVGAIRRLLERAGSLPAGRRTQLAGDLMARIAPRVGGVDRTYPPEEFLARVLREKDLPRS